MRRISVPRPCLCRLALLLLALPGCNRLSTPQVAPGEHSVKLVVVQGPGEGTLALVPVTLEGQGPFNFALDTGASHSVIDRDLADRLHLPVAGAATKVAGVGAVSEATPVRIKEWSLGSVELPAGTLMVVDMPASSRDLKMHGLFGSDILSRFGAVRIDYVNKELTLRPRE